MSCIPPLRREDIFLYKGKSLNPLRKRDKKILEERIKQAVNTILLFLYKLDEEVEYSVREDLLEKYNLKSGAINWGDLGVTEVNYNPNDKTIHIVLEEASSDCVHLKKYILKWMRTFGWDEEIIITTDW